MKHLFILIVSLISINLFSQIPNTLNDNQKVFGLSKFWQEVNYNFVYLNTIDNEKWEKDYIQLISDVQKTNNDYEYFRLLQKFCATLKDGHTNVYFPDTIQQNLYNTYFGDYRLFMTNIDGKAIVTRINLSKKDELPIGTEVIQVNGTETQIYLQEKVIPYISSSTDFILQDWAVSGMFRAPKGTSFNIRFKLPNGNIKDLTLTHTETTEKEVYPEFENSQLLDFKWINEDIAYLALNSFGNPKIDSLFIDQLPTLEKAKKLIIDLRKNAGGSTSIGLEILKYLTHDTLLYGSKMQSRLHIPSFKAWGNWTKAIDTIGNKWATQEYLSFRDNFYHDFEYAADTVRLDANRIVIPTAILIGHQTASAAEDFLIYADKQVHMTKIGKPTFGSTGQPMLIELPGGGSARICTKKDTYPDGKEFVGYGILPDIEAKKTLSDYLKNHDPVLERAIRFLRKN